MSLCAIRLCALWQVLPGGRDRLVPGSDPEVYWLHPAVHEYCHEGTTQAVPGAGPGRLTQGQRVQPNCQGNVLWKVPAVKVTPTGQQTVVDMKDRLSIAALPVAPPQILLPIHILCSLFQFAVLMWLLTYVGALFNGLTLLILGENAPHPTPPHSVLSMDPFYTSGFYVTEVVFVGWEQLKIGHMQPITYLWMQIT